MLRWRQSMNPINLDRVLSFLSSIRFSYDADNRCFVMQSNEQTNRFVPTARNDVEADQILDMWSILYKGEIRETEKAN